MNRHADSWPQELTLALASLLAACGGDGDDTNSDPTSTPEATPTATAAAPAERAAALCASTAAPATATVEVAELVETSGIAASRVNGQRLWAHNDSGDMPRLVLMSTAGRSTASSVNNAEAIDWEDMAIGPVHLAATTTCTSATSVTTPLPGPRSSRIARRSRRSPHRGAA